MSYDEAVAAGVARIGSGIGKRQTEALIQAAMCDWEDFYAEAGTGVAGPGQAVVITADGKGIVICLPAHLVRAGSGRVCACARRPSSRGGARLTSS